MEKVEFQKYLLLAFFAIVVYLAFLIIKPFIIAILTGCVLTYFSHPLYKLLKRFIKNSTASALITTILVIIIILIPLLFVANTIANETIRLVQSEHIVTKIQDFASSTFSNSPNIAILISDTSTKAVGYMKNIAIEFVLDIPSKIISIFITILTLFYLLKIGEPFVNKIKDLLPIRKRTDLINHIKGVTNAVVYGLFLMAIAQFIISLIGLKLLNIPSPFVFALIIGIAAFIPLVGPVIIWLPLAILSLVDGDYAKAIGLVVLGAILGLVDTIIKAKVVEIRTSIHPLIIILGALGGVYVFGFIGFIIGPIFLSSISVIIEEYFPVGEDNEA